MHFPSPRSNPPRSEESLSAFVGTLSAPQARPNADADPVRRELAAMRVNNLESFLAKTDVCCPHCGYSLRGHSGGVCPECGYRLAVVPSRRWPVALAMTPLAMGTVLQGAALLVALCFFVFDRPSRHAALLAMGSAAPFFVVHAFFFKWLIGNRRAFRHRASTFKALTAAGAWALLAAGVAVFRLVNV